jgi:ATP-dependent Clp protease ATP-binding subunit ClpA
MPRLNRESALNRFTRDLTEEARAGRLDPVRCREAEIDRVIDILLRYGKNNPALVGGAGVGKTAIVEGLAQRVVAGTVPLSLKDVRVLSLDHVSLLGGTMYRGQYESRITALVEEVSNTPDVILFVDELHNLIGQGSALGVAMDAGNMLKPALVRGEFRVIGATTSDEYTRWICGDSALERRFQRVDVCELSATDTIEILRARQLRLERHHNVVITDEAIEAAVRITDEYVGDRARPDRAIDALDEACAHTQARAVYSAGTAALVADRRDVLRNPAPQATPSSESSEADRTDEQDDDPLERFARTGFDVLERFGAELEAAIVQQFGDRGSRRAGAHVPQGDASARAEKPPSMNGSPAVPPRAQWRSLAELDELVRRRLVEDGVVVRAHDVARAVAVATGQRVVWQAR